MSFKIGKPLIISYRSRCSHSTCELRMCRPNNTNREPIHYRLTSTTLLLRSTSAKYCPFSRLFTSHFLPDHKWRGRVRGTRPRPSITCQKFNEKTTIILPNLRGVKKFLPHARGGPRFSGALGKTYICPPPHDNILKSPGCSAYSVLFPQ